MADDASCRRSRRSRRRSWPRRQARAAEGSRPPRERGDRARSFLLTFIAVVALAAFLSPLLRSVVYAIKSADQITQAGSPLYPADPVTFDLPGRGADRPAGPDAGRDDAPAGPARAGPQAEHVHRPGEPRRGADRLAGLVADARAGLGASRRTGRTSARSGTSSTIPRLLFNTVAIARHLDDRDAALVHARRVRVRPVQVPGPEPPVHAAHRDDLPAGRGHDHPDLHGLPEARLGRHLAAAARADVLRQRRSTSSSCASTS